MILAQDPTLVLTDPQDDAEVQAACIQRLSFTETKRRAEYYQALGRRTNALFMAQHARQMVTNIPGLDETWERAARHHAATAAGLADNVYARDACLALAREGL